MLGNFCFVSFYFLLSTYILWVILFSFSSFILCSYFLIFSRFSLYYLFLLFFVFLLFLLLSFLFSVCLWVLFSLKIFHKLRLNVVVFCNIFYFLLHCKQNRIISAFINVRCNTVTSRRMHKTLLFSTLDDVVEAIRSKMYQAENQFYSMHLSFNRNFVTFLEGGKWIWTWIQCPNWSDRANLIQHFQALLNSSSIFDSTAFPLKQNHVVILMLSLNLRAVLLIEV